MKIVVFCAIAIEYSAVRDAIASTQRSEDADADLERGVDDDGFIFEYCDSFSGSPASVFLYETGYGQTQAALKVQRALAHIKPDIAVFFGIAGSIKDAQIGDVVIADRVYFYESRKESTSLLARPEALPANERLLNWAKHAARSWNRTESDCRAHVKPIATGNALIANSRSQTVEYIKSHYNDAIAVDMEGSGFMSAAFHGETPAILIRSISDTLSGKSRSDRKGSQELACGNGSRFLVSYLKEIAQAWKPPASLEAGKVYTLEYLGPAIDRLFRKVETAVDVDLVITMSGAGSFVALYMLPKRLRPVPLIVATTFPKSLIGEEEYRKYCSAFDRDSYIKIETRKWLVFVPDIFDRIDRSSNILLLDDRVNAGNTQAKLKTILVERGLRKVYRAALFVDPTEPQGLAEIDFFVIKDESEYFLPWGSRHGRA